MASMGSNAVLKQTVKLMNGKTIPVVGLGTWKLQSVNVVPVVERAIELGCRHIDCAAVYENEEFVGRAIAGVLNNYARFHVERKDLFIVSKLWNTMHARGDVIKACEKTLRDLGLEYLDLYIIHWPFSFEADPDGDTRLDDNGVAIVKPVSLMETWLALEELVHLNKVRSIGVSNFTVSHLQELLKIATIKPVVNQVELHPYLPQSELLNFCKGHDIKVVAYSPLGSGASPSLLGDPMVLKVAQELKLTPAQVLLSWGLTRGTIVIPKTAHVERLEENFALSNKLPDDAMNAIDSINVRYRFCNPIFWWKRDCFDESS